jgi:hypothetical protein
MDSADRHPVTDDDPVVPASAASLKLMLVKRKNNFACAASARGIQRFTIKLAAAHKLSHHHVVTIQELTFISRSQIS